jgi:hypothetical protein
MHTACNCFEITVIMFLEQERQEEHLKEQVAELVEELRVVGGERGIGDLVRLLDRVRDDRLRGLLAVPRTLAPQPLGQLLEVEEGLREISQWCWWPRSSPPARSRVRRRPSSRSPSSPG